jgi:copper chaperone CopZ
MNKKYKLENLGCANCSAKMERKISKLKGVEEASVNFFAGKLILELENQQFSNEESIFVLETEIEKIIKKIEPQVTMKRV